MTSSLQLLLASANIRQNSHMTDWMLVINRHIFCNLTIEFSELQHFLFVTVCSLLCIVLCWTGNLWRFVNVIAGNFLTVISVTDGRGKTVKNRVSCINMKLCLVCVFTLLRNLTSFTFWTSFPSLEWMKLHISNLINTLIMTVTSHTHTHTHTPV